MVPTVLDALGIQPPEQISGVTQSPIEGVSFAHTFDDGEGAIAASHPVLRDVRATAAIYHDGWRAVCPFPGRPSPRPRPPSASSTLTEDKLRELDAKGWELYNLAEDPAETNNLADSNRAKLIEMIALWYVEAGKYNVLPLDSRGTARFADERPQLTADRQTYVYYPHTQAVPENVAVKVLNRAHSLTADVELPSAAPKASWSAMAPTPVATRCSSRTASCTTSTTTSERRNFISSRASPCRKPRRSCATSSSRPANPRSPRARARRAMGKLFINDQLVGQFDLP